MCRYLCENGYVETMHAPLLISAGEELITMLRCTYKSVIIERSLLITLVIICLFKYKYVITFHVLITKFKILIQHISSYSNIISIVAMFISTFICREHTAAMKVANEKQIYCRCGL